MDTPKAPKPSEPHFDWNRFSSCVIESYGSFENPKYFFTHQWFKEQKYPDMLEFIKENYLFSEDTEPNTDISYGFILKKGKDEAVLQVSLVGPYFYLASILSDGSQSEPEYDLTSTDFRLPLLKYMREAGFTFTPITALRKKILFGGESLSAYAILYCYEDEPSWIEYSTGRTT